jgi:hypothetical protein
MLSLSMPNVENAILTTVSQGVSNTPVMNLVLFLKVEHGRETGIRAQDIGHQ